MRGACWSTLFVVSMTQAIKVIKVRRTGEEMGVPTPPCHQYHGQLRSTTTLFNWCLQANPSLHVHKYSISYLFEDPAHHCVHVHLPLDQILSWKLLVYCPSFGPMTSLLRGRFAEKKYTVNICVCIHYCYWYRQGRVKVPSVPMPQKKILGLLP